MKLLVIYGVWLLYDFFKERIIDERIKSGIKILEIGHGFKSKFQRIGRAFEIIRGDYLYMLSKFKPFPIIFESSFGAYYAWETSLF